MLLTKFLLAAAAFTLASCQVAFTNSDYSGIKVGTAFSITWSGATSNVTLLLKNGPSSALATVLTITTGATGTSFSWVPPSTLAPGTYNFEIDASGYSNYSPQFTITGGTGSSSAGSSASAASSTSAKASAITSAAPSSSASATTSTAVTSSASSKSTATVASNTTVSATTTVTRTSGTSTSTSTAVPSSNNAVQYASPFAFVLLTFAAMAALN